MEAAILSFESSLVHCINISRGKIHILHVKEYATYVKFHTGSEI